jgi:hypothetical protein
MNLDQGGSDQMEKIWMVAMALRPQTLALHTRHHLGHAGPIRRPGEREAATLFGWEPVRFPAWSLRGVRRTEACTFPAPVKNS